MAGDPVFVSSGMEINPLTLPLPSLQNGLCLSLLRAQPTLRVISINTHAMNLGEGQCKSLQGTQLVNVERPTLRVLLRPCVIGIHFPLRGLKSPANVRFAIGCSVKTRLESTGLFQTTRGYLPRPRGQPVPSGAKNNVLRDGLLYPSSSMCRARRRS
jgi:hypothetical protein